MTLVLCSVNEVKQGTKCFCDLRIDFRRPLHECEGVPLNLPSIPPGPLLEPGYAVRICPKANEAWHSHDTCVEILAPHDLQDPRDHVMAEETMGVMKDVGGDHFVGLDMRKTLPEGLAYSTQAVFRGKAVVTQCVIHGRFFSKFLLKGTQRVHYHSVCAVRVALRCPGFITRCDRDRRGVVGGDVDQNLFRIVGKVGGQKRKAMPNITMAVGDANTFGPGFLQWSEDVSEGGVEEATGAYPSEGVALLSGFKDVLPFARWEIRNRGP